MIRSFFFIVPLIACLLPLSGHAQLLPTSEPLTLTFSPEHPRPFDTVTVTVGSTLLNLAMSEVTISLNGAVLDVGKTAASFTVGSAGSKNTVRATVSGNEGTFSAQTILVPADVALVIEPAATAHPFYRGGLLIPSESRVRIIALSDLRTSSGVRIPEKDISYSWKVGGRVLTAESGFGKNVLTATAPPRYRDAEVTVTATSRDQTMVAYAATSIAPVDPLVRMYATDPLSGTNFERALSGTFTFIGEEATFKAVPFFFKEPPSFAWRLNSAQSGVADEITVRSSGGSGTAILGVMAANEETDAERSVTLRFGSSSGGIFGF